MAQADEAKPITQLEERLDRQANVSLSGRIIGIVEQSAFDGGFGGLGTAMEAYTTDSAELCMRYRSRNGLYTAQQDFQVAGQGWSNVPFKTEYAGALRKLGGAGIGVKALHAADCDGLDPDATLSLAAIRRRGSSSSAFYVIAHTDRNRARVLVYLKGEASPLSKRCTKLSGSGLIVFDAKCPLPAQAFAEGAKTVLVIFRPDGKIDRYTVPIVPVPSF